MKSCFIEQEHKSTIVPAWENSYGHKWQRTSNDIK